HHRRTVPCRGRSVSGPVELRAVPPRCNGTRPQTRETFSLLHLAEGYHDPGGGQQDRNNSVDNAQLVGGAFHGRLGPVLAGKTGKRKPTGVKRRLGGEYHARVVGVTLHGYAVRLESDIHRESSAAERPG